MSERSVTRRFGRRFTSRLFVRSLLAASVAGPSSYLLHSTLLSPAMAQVAPAPGAQPQPAAPQTFTQEQLDQMLAPIALYPDSLLSQVFMAATYPIEVVDADRWVKANPSLQGDQLAAALDQQTWDPSVKSLVNVPQVLDMMSTQLDWTTRLGDAFIGQQPDVMGRVQALRAQAQQAGQLANTPQQQVTADQGAIVIADTDPNVVYVPVYDPNAVYGTWAYSDYPPFYYYPAGYVRQPGIYWGIGIHLGPPWGYAWGNWDWHRHDLVIDVNRNQNFNRSIDRAHYEQVIARRDSDFHGTSGVWQHDPDHRRGVWYRDPNVAQRYGGASAADAARNRDQYRGRYGTPAAQAGAKQPPIIINNNPVNNAQRNNERTNVQNEQSNINARAGKVPSPTGTQDITHAAPNGQDITKSPPNNGRDITKAAPNTGTQDITQAAPARGQDVSKAAPRTGTQNITKAAPSTPSISAPAPARDQSGVRGGAFNDMGDSRSVRQDSDRGQASRNSNAPAAGTMSPGGAGGNGPPIRGGSPVPSGGGGDSGGHSGGRGGGGSGGGGDANAGGGVRGR